MGTPRDGSRVIEFPNTGVVPMHRVSLTPITHSDFERPVHHWWTYLVPPLRKVPAWSMHLGLVACSAVGRSTAAVGRRLWPVLATPWGDVPGGPMSAGKLMKRACYQIGWIVPGLLAVSAASTYLAVQPPDLTTLTEPARPAGLYAERIELEAVDGVSISAVWIPATAARDAAHLARGGLHERRPAVVLVHDAGHDERQTMPLARRLHEGGSHVLVLQTRSAKPDEASPMTFGATESLDVAAAVEHVRGRPTVDAARVAAWGVGHGGTAVTNADISPPLALAILESMPSADRDLRVLPDGSRFDPLRPACRWLLAVGYDAAPRGKVAPAARTVDIARPVEGYDAVSSQFSTMLSRR